MARLRASWRTSVPVVQQPRNPQSESIARSPYNGPLTVLPSLAGRLARVTGEIGQGQSPAHTLFLWTTQPFSGMAQRGAFLCAGSACYGYHGNRHAARRSRSDQAEALMTYCVGILVEDGLVMIADTRTNV